MLLGLVRNVTGGRVEGICGQHEGGEVEECVGADGGEPDGDRRNLKREEVRDRGERGIEGRDRGESGRR